MGRMTIEETRRCNLFSLQLIAQYYNTDFEQVLGYYNELLEDQEFLAGLNTRMKRAREQFNYSKGLFSHTHIDNVDWFANQRVTLYVLLRLLKPEVSIETGVLYGGNTAFMLNAINKNKKGRLISIDLLAKDYEEQVDIKRHSKVGDSELLPNGLEPGFIIPEHLLNHWQFIQGDSLQVLSSLNTKYSFFCHDSEHSRTFVLKELSLAIKGLESNGTILADDIDWSNGFFEFCVNHKLYPLCLTDNGKDDLRIRTGIVRLDHPNNNKSEITGKSEE